MLEEPTAQRSYDPRRGSSDDERASARRSSTAPVATIALALLIFSGHLFAQATAASTEPASCQTVRFSDIGWTDVTATTGLTSYLVRRLGYKPVVTVLSVPVTYASLKNKDIDIYLGNWMPAQDAG